MHATCASLIHASNIFLMHSLSHVPFLTSLVCAPAFHASLSFVGFTDILNLVLMLVTFAYMLHASLVC